MRKIKSRVKRVVSVALSTMMVLSVSSIRAFSAETDDTFVTEGTYHFTTNSGNVSQCEDSFIYRDDCFMRSSFLGCEHLSLLSSQVCGASISWNGAADPKDYSNDSKNLTTFMKDMGFQDVETNIYYTIEKEEDSIGVAIGHRTIKCGGKEYTLLAIFPRGAGYKQEWAGNFNVGGGDYHEGFMQARDEALRFAKKYVTEHNISGDLKIWTAGHSRAASVANMIGGFFADGGVQYLGSNLALTPEDVYCYTYGTPRTVKNGLSRNEELSVGASRGGVYINDTPGEAYTYSDGGNVDIKSSNFNGIRNHIFMADIIAKLPLSSWGFDYYGQQINISEAFGVSEDDMLEEFKTLNPSGYEAFVKSGDYRNFKLYTFDPLEMSTVEDTSVPSESWVDFSDGRLKALQSVAPTSEEYSVNGTQYALVHLLGLFGILMNDVDSSMLSNVSFVKPLLFTYLSYAAEKLLDEGRATTDEEAAAIAIGELIEFITGDDIDLSTFTIDNFLEKMAKYLVDNKDSKLSQTAFSGIENAFPESYKGIVSSLLGLFNKDATEGKTVEISELIYSLLYACAYGPEEGSRAASMEDYNTPQKSRMFLYGVLGAVIPMAVPSISYDTLQGIIGVNAEGNMDGSGSFSGGVGMILTMLMTESDDSGSVTQTFSSFDEAADYYLADMLESALMDKINMLKDKYGDQIYNEALAHLDYLENNISVIRRVLPRLLFYNENEAFDTKTNVRNIATFVNAIMYVPDSHMNETYLSFMHAAVKKSDYYEDHYIEHIDEIKAGCETDGSIEYWHRHDTDGETYFKDKYLGEAVAKEDTVVPKLGHLAGAAVIENQIEPTYDTPGSYEEVTYCERCGKEMSRVKIEVPVKIRPDDTPSGGDTPGDNSGSTPASNTPAKSANTGDESPIMMCYILMMVGLVGVAGTFAAKKKGFRKNH